MKQLLFFISSAILCFCLSSCSGIFRTWYYTTHYEGREMVEHRYGGKAAYASEGNPTAIIFRAKSIGPSAVIVGPMLLPVVFPTCLQFWAKEDITLEVNCVFNLQPPYTIYPQSIHFVNKEGQTMSPSKIKCEYVGSGRVLLEIDSTASPQEIKAEAAMRLSWFFKGKQARVKAFSIMVNAPPINVDGGKPLFILFKRRAYYQYVPLLVH